MCLQVPRKTGSYFADFERIVNSITLQDIHSLLLSLGMRRESMWEAIGVSGPVPPAALSRPPKQAINGPSITPSKTRLRASGSGDLLIAPT